MPWTVMVYMQAADDAKLEAAAIRDLKELQKASTNSAVDLVVCLKRDWPGLGLFGIQQSVSNPLAPGHSRSKDFTVHGTSKRASRQTWTARLKDPAADMGDPATLESFLDFVVEDVSGNAADRRYLLVLWGHAYGLGFGRDHHDALTLTELHGALDHFKATRGSKLDLLGANACAMSYVEAAYELREVVDYMVSSQTSVPFAGWPYDKILSNIKADATPEAVGRLIVDGYTGIFNASPTGHRVEMSLLHLDAAADLAADVEGLTQSLNDYLTPGGQFSPDRLAEVRDLFLGSATNDIRPLLDVVELCTGLREVSGVSGGDAKPDDDNAVEKVKAAAEKLAALCHNPPLVVHHRSHQDLDNLNGVGIFAPFVSDSDTLLLGLSDESNGDVDRSAPAARAIRAGVGTSGKRSYESLSMFGGLPKGPYSKADASALETSDGRWPTLVYDTLSQNLPDEIVSCIDNAGVNGREDRAEVTQLMAGMDAVFNRLDRTIQEAQSKTSECIARWAATGQWEPPETMGAFRLLQLFNPSLFKDRIGLGRSSDELNHARVIATSLLRVEAAIAAAEKNTLRLLTNERFGLGPPDVKSGRLPDMKPGALGLPDLKPGGLGLPDLKPGALGLPDLKPGALGLDLPDLKPGGLGIDDPLAWLNLMNVATSDPQTGWCIVAKLFEQVGKAFYELENAAAGVEVTLANVLSGPALGPNWSVAERQQLMTMPIARAFKIARQSSMAARRIVLQAVSHPVYGLGPGPEGAGSDYRRFIADSGGFSSDRLALL